IHRSHEGSTAEPRGPLLPGQGPDQHGAQSAGPSGHHPGRWFRGRPRARGAHVRCRVLGRAGAGERQGGISRSEEPAREAPSLAPVTVLPGVMPIIGSTESEAREKLSRLQSWLTPANALTLVTSRIGYDVTGYPLDGPVPAPPPGEGSQAFSRVLYETARREH